MLLEKFNPSLFLCQLFRFHSLWVAIFSLQLVYKVWNKFNMHVSLWVCFSNSDSQRLTHFFLGFPKDYFCKSISVEWKIIIPLPVFGNLRFSMCSTDRSDAELLCTVWVAILNSLLLDGIYLCHVSTGGLSSILLEVALFSLCAWVSS